MDATTFASLDWFTLLLAAHPYVVGLMPFLAPVVLFIVVQGSWTMRREAIERQSRAAWGEHKPRR